MSMRPSSRSRRAAIAAAASVVLGVTLMAPASGAAPGGTPGRPDSPGNSAGKPGSPPIVGLGDPETTSDPLPQAMVLTAIVITMAVTIFMLALAVLGHNDDTQRMPETGEEHDR